MGSVCHGYMCIFLYMKLFHCSGFAEIYCLLEDGGVSLPFVYMHSAIYKTFSVYWFCIDLLLIRGGGIGSVFQGDMFILLYMKFKWCSGFPEI